MITRERLEDMIDTAINISLGVVTLLTIVSFIVMIAKLLEAVI